MRCAESGWTGQFGRPSGWRGALVGRLMAVKNAEIGRLAVETLGVGERDRVLEIGFGPGKAIGEVARRATEGHVAGLDRSEVMLRQALRRNRAAVAAGRVELRLGDVSNLPWPDGAFTAVFEVNSFHHWPDPLGGLREARRVLADGGRLLLCLRMKHPSRSVLVAPGHEPYDVDRVVGLLERAGFARIRRVAGSAGGREVCCLRAERAAG